MCPAFLTCKPIAAFGLRKPTDLAYKTTNVLIRFFSVISYSPLKACDRSHRWTATCSSIFHPLIDCKNTKQMCMDDFKKQWKIRICT